VLLRGRANANADIELLGLSVTGAQWNGIAVDAENGNVSIRECVITGNARNGVTFDRVGGTYTIENSEIRENGHNGVDIGRDVVTVLSANVIAENGVAGGQGGGRYGISRDRQPQAGTPEQVTLLSNTLFANNGRPQAGRSDENIRNYDQIIDATDEQSPYTD
jgi:hypothetical protein